ncbi:phytoene desaturase [Chryseomicrobium aureum]|uniref:phytoene desaturase family protein n=1 Tax=Chryseomicrobium aureum TaxID=1441723 RepID=UPI00195BB0F3|nr:phytoene desaturase family protein [Chryseomicrobium aureum]MBM7707453.1 phytoene desaturase [Chryseomicrobium aureum]
MTIALIGGGVGGLMTALYLTEAGHEVTIYEKSSKLGGRLAFVKNGEYRIDEGPTIVLLPDMFLDLLKKAGVDTTGLRLLRCDPLYSMQFSDGEVYTKYADPIQQQQEIERLFPKDAEGFKQFLTEGKQRFDIGMTSFLTKSFSVKKDFWTFTSIRKLLALKPYQSVSGLMKGYFKDSRLQQAYALQSLYIGGNPYQVPAMYSLVSFSEHEHGVYYLQGGYASLIPLLDKTLRARGVTIHLNSAVETIHLEDGRATGVKTKNGSISHDAVVFNGEMPFLKELLPSVPNRTYIPSSSCYLMYIGVDSKYENRLVHSYLMGPDFKGHMDSVFRTKELPNEPSIYVFNPSVMDDSLAPKGKSVLYILVPVPSGTAIEWENVNDWRERILDRIEENGFPNLRERTEWMEIRTPATAQAEGYFQGGNFGIAPVLGQSGVFRPQAKPTKFNNLYAVGASTHPGGGIPIVMQGAYLTAQTVLNDLTVKGGQPDERQASLPRV